MMLPLIEMLLIFHKRQLRYAQGVNISGIGMDSTWSRSPGVQRRGQAYLLCRGGSPAAPGIVLDGTDYLPAGRVGKTGSTMTDEPNGPPPNQPYLFPMSLNNQ
ncbi:hypothetical protein N431DRAFT_58799 [Stipitochalara longipes BDJ]|nr:hypothetical protein N431DRAFT_58799 [Stipitochalara longipes BDJ]